MQKGLVFDIKRFAVHDGAGIRTTVFLKSCPLRCKWCHNPEGLELERAMWHVRAKCIGCGECLRACPAGVLALEAGEIRFHAERCAGCGACTSACPTGAQRWDSEWLSVDEVMYRILRDQIPYSMSGGGVTVSGGEPTYQQREFALALLHACKEAGLNTAIESCMLADAEVVDRFMEVVDQFIVDIKIFDGERHAKATGADNHCILENIRRIAEKKPVLIRTPMIPGYTDDLENITAIADFVASLKAPNVCAELINFNPLYAQKYAHRGASVESFGDKLSGEAMRERQQIFLVRGIECLIG